MLLATVTTAMTTEERIQVHVITKRHRAAARSKSYFYEAPHGQSAQKADGRARER